MEPKGDAMRPVCMPFRSFCTKTRLAIAAQFLIANFIFMSNAAGQIINSAPQAPPPAIFQNTIPGDQLSFLKGYGGRPAKEVMKDKRFRDLIKTVIPRTEYHYGRDMPLYDTSRIIMDGSRLPVQVREGRYVMVSSDLGPYLSGRGLLWFDIKEGIILGGVFFHPVNGEPTPTLAIFSRQLRETSLAMSQLPTAFAEDLSHWAQTIGVPAVTTRYFIPANGDKYVLVHDEDYCAHPANVPAPQEDECENANADAADVDMNAADFMAQTDHAANATAWTLGLLHVQWISPVRVKCVVFRNQRCGTGPHGLICRTRITRERTNILLNQGRR
jgi:hypothetical protein